MYLMSKALRLLICLLPLLVGTDSKADIVVNLGRGAVTIFTPASYDSTTPTPLILLLHGYGSNGAAVDSWMGFESIIDTYGFLYAHPNGTKDAGGNRFWNATDACCNFGGSSVDDAGYLSALIDTVADRFNLDPDRVYIGGHSNGGFMSYRMACDYSGRVAAIMSLAGATWDNDADCNATSPVHIAQVHGTSDATILYNGGQIGAASYPGAFESVSRWAGYDGCNAEPETLIGEIDLVLGPATESDIIRFNVNCSPGGSAELWKIPGSGHTPVLSSGFAAQVVEFFYAHPKPGVTDVAAAGEILPVTMGLSNSPNPFRHTSTLRFLISRPGLVDIEIFDLRGRLTRIIERGAQFPAGPRTIEWNGRDDQGRVVPPGIYFARLRTGERIETRKLTLLR